MEKQTIITSVVTAVIASIIVVSLFMLGTAGNLAGSVETIRKTFSDGFEVPAQAKAPVIETAITINGAVTASAALTASGETSLQGVTDGSGALPLATSTGTTILTQVQLLADSLLEITVNTGTSATIQLPATSTMTTLFTGESRHRAWLIHNATTSTMAMTITAGTGIDLIGVTTNDDVIDETEYSELECWMQISTDVVCKISEWLHVD